MSEQYLVFVDFVPGVGGPKPALYAVIGSVVAEDVAGARFAAGRISGYPPYRISVAPAENYHGSTRERATELDAEREALAAEGRAEREAQARNGAEAARYDYRGASPLQPTPYVTPERIEVDPRYARVIRKGTHGPGVLDDRTVAEVLALLINNNAVAVEGGVCAGRIVGDIEAIVDALRAFELSLDADPELLTFGPRLATRADAERSERRERGSSRSVHLDDSTVDMGNPSGENLPLAPVLPGGTRP